MYNDPLHIPSAELVVEYKGKPLFMLNKRLLDRQNCWTNLDKIKEKHIERLDLEDHMFAAVNENDRGLLALYDALYDLIEYELQELWKFTQDGNFHRFWERPGCGCPRLDNNDRYPTGFYVRSLICPLHGDY